MSEQVAELRRTPLYQEHAKLGARFTPFGGWEMPVQYSGVIAEHLNVRAHAGIFDVSHMGEIFVRGPQALAFLQYVSTNDLSKLIPGRAQYGMLLYDSGGVVDDIIVYQLASQEFLLCVNASNAEKDFSWLQEHNTFGVELENASDRYAQLAVQGPAAFKILAATLEIPVEQLSLASFAGFSVSQLPSFAGDVIVARTGYTGEDGFEIFCDTNAAVPLWQRLIESGSPQGLKPIGLAARDTLRLEASLPLYGHELRADLTPIAAGFSWAVKMAKGEFIGRHALERESATGPVKKLVGLEVLDRGIIREGNLVYSETQQEVGWVTSGTKTPSLEQAVGLAYVPASHAMLGIEYLVDVRGRKLRCKIIKTPFYKRRTVT